MGSAEAVLVVVQPAVGGEVEILKRRRPVPQLHRPRESSSVGVKERGGGGNEGRATRSQARLRVSFVCRVTSQVARNHRRQPHASAGAALSHTWETRSLSEVWLTM